MRGPTTCGLARADREKLIGTAFCLRHMVVNGLGLRALPRLWRPRPTEEPCLLGGSPRVWSFVRVLGSGGRFRCVTDYYHLMSLRPARTIVCLP